MGQKIAYIFFMFQWFLRPVLKLHITLQRLIPSFQYSIQIFRPNWQLPTISKRLHKANPRKKNSKFRSTKHSSSHYISSSATYSNNPLPITVPSSLDSALLFLQPTFTGRKSGHCLGKFRAVNFLFPPPPALNVVSFTTLPSAVSASPSSSCLMQDKIMYRANTFEDKIHISSHLADNSLYINYNTQEVNGIQRKNICLFWQSQGA